MIFTVLSYVVLAILIWKHRPIFFGSWNIARENYKVARKATLAMYIVCWGVLLAIVATVGWGSLFTGEGRNTPLTTPLFKVFSLLFVVSVLLLDANLGQSRKHGYERNFFKHWLLGLTFILPVLVSCVVNRPLIALFLVVTVSGWFTRKAAKVAAH
ncbi:hypothetical protein PE066_18985 [Ramlibacter tataouinensis]|uniref:hypothetical protein n=1 Tax=Ramlibacter tataouinensis TaxID=94132 RepID=UPI0022F3C81C|nr:hypothetical protein [Ramlibacter tataouinensis]WBY01525.1 hypothetical protein PE066_18985 [Ramlibacter tataouinensis]